jgi:hypothetical protein
MARTASCRTRAFLIAAIRRRYLREGEVDEVHVERGREPTTR